MPTLRGSVVGPIRRRCRPRPGSTSPRINPNKLNTRVPLDLTDTAAPGDVPGTDLPTHRRDRVLADRREETHEMLSPPVLGQSRTERVPQERERRDLMIVTPVRVLAVHHVGLVRM